MCIILRWTRLFFSNHALSFILVLIKPIWTARVLIFSYRYEDTSYFMAFISLVDIPTPTTLPTHPHQCIDFRDNSSPPLPSPPHKHILEYIQRNFLPIYSAKSLPNHNHILIDVYFALLMYYI